MSNSGGRKVFAHYLVGLTASQTRPQWEAEILAAREAGIDGFALNVGPHDPWTQAQLRLAYSTANDIAPRGGFVMFISFDMAAGEWTISQVINLIREFSALPAQFKVDGLPFVSTFEGPHWASNWKAVREATGGIFLVPSWTSIGPQGILDNLGIIDGAFSWSAWPRADETRMITSEDILYKQHLDDKKYMMGVSPWFYTRLPQWHKNWYSASESLWYDRWMQVLEVLPDFVQIISWNDYGESHYIGDMIEAQIISGAEGYITGFSHSAFRAVLPYFIAAFKGEEVAVPSQGSRAIAWYRTTYANCGHDGGTVWGQGGTRSARTAARDVVSVMTITCEPTTIVVGIGASSQTLVVGTQSAVSYREIPFGGNLGPVTLQMREKVATGPAITDSITSSECVNFNCVAIEV